MATVGTKRTAAIYDLDPYAAAGIDPNSGLPTRCANSAVPNANLKSDIKKQLRILDEQDAVNRFEWYNLPPELDGNLIERILYYKGQGALVKLPDEKFYFLPFALDGTIDVYGRFTSITPLPFNGTTTKDGKAEPLIKGLSYEPRYQVMLPEEYIDIYGNINQTEIADHISRSAFILRDYTQQISQTNISRQILNDPILDIMADCIPFMRTNLLNSTGVTGMRVSNADEAPNVIDANIAMNRAALVGDKYVPIVGSIEFQELTNGNVGNSEEYMLAMQSLDNYRLSLYGLDNGGLFQKKAHMLETEQEMNQSITSLALYDSLKLRQEWCTILNSYFGWGVFCKIRKLDAQEETQTKDFTNDTETEEEVKDENV